MLGTPWTKTAGCGSTATSAYPRSAGARGLRSLVRPCSASALRLGSRRTGTTLASSSRNSTSRRHADTGVRYSNRQSPGSRNGEAEGLIVWKADRFGRDLIDGLVQIRRVRDMGGVFVSVYDNLDTSTSTGRMVLRIMLSIAENRLEEISEQWRTAKARAVARGVHPTAIAPFGYRHANKKNRWRQHWSAGARS